MPKIGFHASHEQFAPSELLRLVGEAEAAGFDCAMSLPWPEKAERNARLRECADVIRALLRGETVCHRGRIVVVDARLYSLPRQPPRLLAAAVTEATAELAGVWADGLLTVNGPPHQVRKVIEAFRRGGGERKPLLMKVGLNGPKPSRMRFGERTTSGATTYSAAR